MRRPDGWRHFWRESAVTDLWEVVLVSCGSARRVPARPSILAITSELPWPLDRGGHLRSFHLLRGLAADFDLRLIAPIEPGQDAHVPVLSAEGIRVCPVPVGPRSRADRNASSVPRSIDQRAVCALPPA